MNSCVGDQSKFANLIEKKTLAISVNTEHEKRFIGALKQNWTNERTHFHGNFSWR